MKNLRELLPLWVMPFFTICALISCLPTNTPPNNNKPIISSFSDESCSFNSGIACSGNIIRDIERVSGVTTYTSLQWVVTGAEPLTLRLNPGDLDVTGLNSLELTDIEKDDVPIKDSDLITYTLTASNAAGSTTLSLNLNCCTVGIPDIMD